MICQICLTYTLAIHTLIVKKRGEGRWGEKRKKKRQKMRRSGRGRGEGREGGEEGGGKEEGRRGGEEEKRDEEEEGGKRHSHGLPVSEASSAGPRAAALSHLNCCPF